jgi:hypothetical protein
VTLGEGELELIGHLGSEVLVDRDVVVVPFLRRRSAILQHDLHLPRLETKAEGTEVILEIYFYGDSSRMEGVLVVSLRRGDLIMGTVIDGVMELVHVIAVELRLHLRFLRPIRFRKSRSSSFFESRGVRVAIRNPKFRLFLIGLAITF